MASVLPTLWMLQANPRTEPNFVVAIVARSDPRLHRNIMKPIVAVVGSYRSGTSVIANVLHSLGVSMGEAFEPATPAYQRGSFEAKWLLQLCHALFCEESLVAISSKDKRIAGLREWRKMRNDSSPSAAIGAKHPLLCMMIDEMVEAWPGVRFVFADRPIEESELSLAATGWPWVAKTSPDFIRRMIDAREASAKRLTEQPLRIGYHELLDNCGETIDRLIDWLALPELTRNRESAIAAIDPMLRHHRLA
jgi:hypothetical protein